MPGAMIPAGCRSLLLLSVWLYWSSVVVSSVPSPTSSASSVLPVELMDDPDDDLQQLPYPSDLDKRAYSYVSSYKRLPVYNFGLGKRGNKMAYSFGLGKRPQMYSFGLGKRVNQDYGYPAMGKRPKEMYSFGLGKRDTSEYEDWDDNNSQEEDKRAPKYAFGLGKRRAYSFGLGKRSPQMYSFGLGKRAPMYGFGLGKRERMYGFGLGKRPDYNSQRFSFGLGKRSMEEEDEEDAEDKREVNPSEMEEVRQEADNQAEVKRRSPYSFGLGKKAYDFGLGKRPKQYSFGMGKKSEGMSQ